MQTGNLRDVTVWLGDCVYLAGYLVPSTDGCWHWPSNRSKRRAFTNPSAWLHNPRQPRRVHDMGEAIFQGIFFIQALSFAVHKQRNNCVSLRRYCLIKRPITNVQSREEKTHIIYGLRCEISEVRIRRDVLVIWELWVKSQMKVLGVDWWCHGYYTMIDHL